jgi:hypothetical protein
MGEPRLHLAPHSHWFQRALEDVVTQPRAHPFAQSLGGAGSERQGSVSADLQVRDLP